MMLYFRKKALVTHDSEGISLYLQNNFSGECVHLRCRKGTLLQNMKRKNKREIIKRYINDNKQISGGMAEDRHSPYY